MIPNRAENVFLSIVQAVTEVLNKSHFSLQMGNCPIPIAEHSGPYLLPAFFDLLRSRYGALSARY